VTLKTLSLQTLQSEYSSLLQKVQRDKLRSQTIEKKAAVAEDELNGLTTRNEELTEQIKLLQSNLEDSEHRGENTQKEFAREKSQWVKMLDMHVRLQAKGAEAKKVWDEEKAHLLETIAAAETGRQVGGNSEQEVTSSANKSLHVSSAKATAEQVLNTEEARELQSLRHEVGSLSVQIAALRKALDDVRSLSAGMDAQAKAWLDSNVAVSERAGAALYALQHDDPRFVE